MVVFPRGYRHVSGTGYFIPNKFFPPDSTPNATPDHLFLKDYGRTRFVHRLDELQCLFFADGACLENGSGLLPRGGIAYVVGPGQGGTWADPLPTTNHYGEYQKPTNNRAELKASIEALRFFIENRQSFNSLVIATDSQYVVQGITNWMPVWLNNGWRANNGLPVQNQDLWNELLDYVQMAYQKRLSVQFWRIPRELNQDADAAAKWAAERA